MSDLEIPRTAHKSWHPNPLREKDETLAVLDIWGDFTNRRPRSPRYGRWIIGVAVAGLCAWAASTSFPLALHYVSGG